MQNMCFFNLLSLIDLQKPLIEYQKACLAHVNKPCTYFAVREVERRPSK